ncbi:molybdopterin-dependent oxidoreductase [Clostridium bowmanii]|uniref:molybdopterin-dependent oxidoreductase n=1 Tax=Clostridium bowmanii TaxID=132925 RepID=UPI001C0BF1B7|nr:molybdopterin-dependent oxidoreductase [Clostridium bowmanii]MBU3188076.1 molybdopterin-dependent oxidoreductase [Clostridium bowmanii]MCA1072257.1 molybdopterin-dependent oxidoreductase [Clostridium bowmanii]
MKKVLTTCGYCGCGCNYYINVDNNEIVGITPKNNDIVSKGKLCVKGWQLYICVNHNDRLKQPLIKNKDGIFEEVTWEIAFEFINKSLKNIIEKNGPKAVRVSFRSR